MYNNIVKFIKLIKIFIKSFISKKSELFKARKFVSLKKESDDFFSHHEYEHYRCHRRYADLFKKLTEDKELYSLIRKEIMKKSDSHLFENIMITDKILDSALAVSKEEYSDFFHYINYYNIIDIERLRDEFSTKTMYRIILAKLKKVKISFYRMVNLSDSSYVLWPFPSGTAYPPLFS